LLWKLLLIGMVVALKEREKVEDVIKATQRPAGAGEIKGVLVAPPVLSNCLRELAGG
jgi:hypothetical protein